MKGLISGIKRMEIHDGDGLRTTVFFKGCPLKCIWCHNPESIAFDEEIAYFEEKCIGCGACGGVRDEKGAAVCPVDAIYKYGREYGVDELCREVLQDAPFFRLGGGVTLSGGECLAQPELAVALAKRLYSEGVSVYIDTCGYVKREIFEEIFPFVDKFLYDVKAIDESVHEKCTGKGSGLILDNLRYLASRGAKIEIRYPLVKGYNDGECEGIARLLSELCGIEKVKVLKYHSLSASRYRALNMENTLPNTETTLADVESAVKTFKKYGLNAVNGALED